SSMSSTSCSSAQPSAPGRGPFSQSRSWAEAPAESSNRDMPDSAVTTATRPPLVDDVIDGVRDAATSLRADVYLVGGFVRDRLRGSPGKDLDLVSVGSDGEPVLRRV